MCKDVYKTKIIGFSLLCFFTDRNRQTLDDLPCASVIKNISLCDCVLYRVKCKLLAELCKSRMEHIFTLNWGALVQLRCPRGEVGDPEAPAELPI